jgi:2-desacetyl-2-hydroxyethyl bacteriochlorophyllide A dehydrogenase
MSTPIIMRALRFHGNRHLSIDDIPIPALKPGWVLIHNAFSGICGSDLHEYLIGPKTSPTTPHVLTGETIPSVLGHEFSGTVVELGEGVRDLKFGDRCAVFPVLTCGTCGYCREEVYGMCASWGFLGYSGWGGGMAEYIAVDRNAVFRLPDSVGLEVGALVEPLAVGWHAVKVGGVREGTTALVLGAGPIGIAVILCLRAFGVKRIVVSELSPLRKEHARNVGAEVLDPSEGDVVRGCRELSDGLGPHVVFECAGVQASLNTAVEAVRGKGTIVNIAIFEKEVTFPVNVLNRKSVTFVGSNISTRGEFQEVIDAIADGRLEGPERMITARVPLEDGVEGGFEELIRSRDKHVKILIRP